MPGYTGLSPRLDGPQNLFACAEANMLSQDGSPWWLVVFPTWLAVFVVEHKIRRENLAPNQ
jgi:hypothetical protein